MKKIISGLAAGVFLALVVPLAAQTTNDSVSTNSVPTDYKLPPLQQPSGTDDPWTSLGIGQGFSSHAQEVGVSLGAGEETRDLGGKAHHDIALSRFYYGHVLDDLVGAGHWYNGNFEMMPEVFGGAQYYRESRYVFGATAIVRYSVATGTRWVPFLDAGGGGSLTNIKNPDLGSIEEFNAQIGPGFMWFWRDNVALTLQYRYLHMSSAGLSSPNQGVNENIAYVGMSWFF
jgi:lipid A 3-O-deacylase